MYGKPYIVMASFKSCHHCNLINTTAVKCQNPTAMLRNYLLITFRNLSQNRVFVLINMLGMGIAIACCITAYLNWDFSTNFDKNHVNSESIYRIQAYYDVKGKQNR